MSLISDILPPVLTAGVAVAGLLQAGKQATRVYGREREAALAAEREAEQRRELARAAARRSERNAARRRFDERFAQAVQNLGSDNAMQRAAGAALVQAMVREPETELADQTRALLVGALQLEQDHHSQRQLVAALELALRRRAEARPTTGNDDVEIDLTRIRAPGMNLTSVDLGRVDVAFADLSRASLAQATLSRSRGYGVRLEGAILNQAVLREVKWHRAKACDAHFKWATLTSAELRGGDFRRADFFRSELQSAHLDGADLRGARFDGANLTDTYLRDAWLDRVALESILRAHDWQRAFLDEGAVAWLRTIAEQVQAPRR
jgi:uncharacterized protein YjbI with pentapeptide repeats